MDRPPARVLYLVVCAAPPARKVGELVDLLQHAGWAVCVITTPTATAWVDTAQLRHHTGHPVRSQPRRPEEPDPLPPASALVVAPATFNTINKWACGVSDTFALGILNELLGLGVPILVSPYAKPALTSHPAFRRSLRMLRGSGAHVTAVEALRPAGDVGPFRWSAVTEPLRRLVPTTGGASGGAGGAGDVSEPAIPGPRSPDCSEHDPAT
ncbi:MAG: flavoprotein [Micromonosporaceae bacterium]|nr:flavoprotein [Micromonosporaceae bacterium]